MMVIVDVVCGSGSDMSRTHDKRLLTLGLL